MPPVQLLEMTGNLREAFRQGPGHLGHEAGLAVPEGWPEYPDLLSADPTPGWPLFLFVDAARKTILGSGGFLCAPDAKNEMQIGYEVAPAYRGQGIATEAMQQVLATRTSARPIAVTLTETGPSVSVLRKLGFIGIGAHTPAGGATVWMWAR